jgi:hypothetical protein
MKNILEFSMDQLHEVERGLVLRVAECKKMHTQSKAGVDKQQWGEQLTCAVNTLAFVEDIART